jgi:hypothetical protein
MNPDRIATLISRIDDLFNGEAMADISEALKIMVALYLFDQEERCSADFFLDVLALCEDYKNATKKMTPDDIERAKNKIARLLSGH